MQAVKPRLLIAVTGDPIRNFSQTDFDRRSATSVRIEVAVLRSQKVATLPGLSVEQGTGNILDRVDRVARSLGQARGVLQLCELTVSDCGQCNECQYSDGKQETDGSVQCDYSARLVHSHLAVPSFGSMPFRVERDTYSRPQPAHIK